MQPPSSLLPSHSKPAFIRFFVQSADFKYYSTYIRVKYCIKETWCTMIIILYSSFDYLSPSALFSCSSLAPQANPGTGSLVETKELEQTNEAAHGGWQSPRKMIRFSSSPSGTACPVQAPPPPPSLTARYPYSMTIMKQEGARQEKEEGVLFSFFNSLHWFLWEPDGTINPQSTQEY